MYLVTYASEPHRISFREHCWNLWDGEPYRGLMQKIHNVQGFARTVNPKAVICFVDGYDVQLEGTAKQIESAYRALGIDGVLMSAETNCFPYSERASEYPRCATPFRFVNSGCYIGTAQELLRLFDRMRVDRIPSEVNDQAVFTDFYLANPSAFALDTNCELFQSLFAAHQYIEKQEGVFTNTLTGTRPLVFHGNGGAGLLKERDID